MTVAQQIARPMLARSLPHGLKRFAGSLSVTLIGQALMLMGLFLVTRVSVHAFGAQGFGEYQVARRTLAVVAFPLMCGLGISLPRYISRDISVKSNVSKWMYSGLVLSVVLITVFIGLGVAFAPQIGRWTFGDNGRFGLVVSLLIAAVGMFCATLAAAVMRGLSRFQAAAILQVINGAMVPLCGVLLAKCHVERALMITGGLWIVIACVLFVRLGREWTHPNLFDRQFRAAMRELIVYGAPRVPGDIALFGLFALPAYAAVHRHDILGAGFLSVGLSLVQAIATGFASAGFVLLPYWSRAAKDPKTLNLARKRIGMLIVASALISGIGLGLLQLFLLPVVRLLLGPLAASGLHDIRYITLSAVPYVVYLVLRDYFDAVSVFPINTGALGAAILVQFTLLNVHWLSVPLATAASFLGLGLIMVTVWAISPRRIALQAQEQ